MKTKNLFCKSRIFNAVCLTSCFALLVACSGTTNDGNYEYVETPSVDYVEGLDVYSAQHRDSFLIQLAMNYRSYAVYNARTLGMPEVGEVFAQKAIVAFSGETPFPETLASWQVDDSITANELRNAYNSMINAFRNDATEEKPEIAAEVQAKYDCWLSATSLGQTGTAMQCRERFEKALNVLNGCSGNSCHLNIDRKFKPMNSSFEVVETTKSVRHQAKRDAVYYPDTRSMRSLGSQTQPRDGIVIVNNINVPDNLVQPRSVSETPMVFNQNIYGGDKTINKNNGNSVNTSGCSNSCDCASDDAYVYAVVGDAEQSSCCCDSENEEIQVVTDDLVTRDEFIDMMMAMREELRAISEKIDNIKMPSDEKTVIKVQQIPLEPKQHVMEEVFEILFDFDKATIKPEYRDLIKQLAQATQENKNVKVSVVGHTDTVGSSSYNYALGGERAAAVRKMLIENGIPAGQIVAVSAGKEDLKVPTPNGVKNAENRRVRVVKETHFSEPVDLVPVADVQFESIEK